MEDFLSAGRVGLVQAARRFDSRREACFRTFAGRRIKGEMLELVRRRHLREDSHVDLPAAPPSADDVDSIDRRCRVVSILSGLAPQEREALTARFLEDGNMRHVARRLGVSVGEAGRIVRTSLERARQREAA